jgi:protein-disulfide isomerase
MSKKNRGRREGEAGDDSKSGGGNGGSLNWLPIVLAAGALVLGFVAWTDTKTVKDDLTKRLVDMDTKVLQLEAQVASAAKAKSAPPQQGPDPNKVYTVRTEGSPTKGSPTAPIVIAEFSDFQ